MRNLLELRIWGFALLGMLAFVPLRAVQADEWEESSPYYEDDAWYDVSEWLDGNDFNPTDEMFGRWDDENYDGAVATTDSDNDRNSYSYDDDYGYDDSYADDNWFYDYYDHGYSYYDGLLDDDHYTYSSRYYDYDNDGIYDAYSSYADTDGDGIYEDYDFYSFNTDLDFDTDTSTVASNQSQANQSQSGESGKSESNNNQAAAQQKDLSSKRLAVSGTIERTKQVKVPKGPVRLVVEVKDSNDQKLLVDLGPMNQFAVGNSASEQANSDQEQSSEENSSAQGAQVVKKGEKIVAHGPAIKVGDKKLILAQTVQFGNQDQRQILRTGNTVKGKINKMKTAEVRGLNHQLVILDLDSGKQALIDLGRKENLPNDLQEGDQIEVTGIPTKVKDRLVFIANSISKDGDRTKIDRMTASASQQAAR